MRRGSSVLARRLQASRLRDPPADAMERSRVQGSDPSPRRLQLQRCAQARGLTPCRPTAIASQRLFRSRVWEEEQGARACARRPFDLLPGDWAQERPARSRPHLPGCLLGQLTDPGRPRTSASPHPGPALALGWSVHHARRGIRTTAPGSCAEGRAAVSPRISSPRHAQKNTFRGLRHAPPTYIINPKNLSPPLPPHGDSSRRAQARGLTPSCARIGCRPALALLRSATRP